jgi:hypothetical protein
MACSRCSQTLLISGRAFGRIVGWLLRVAVLGLWLALSTSAQYGTAPPASYPIGYSGATGKVVETSDDTITLTNTRGSKTDRFVGHTAATCHMPVTKTTTFGDAGDEALAWQSPKNVIRHDCAKAVRITRAQGLYE